LYCMLTLSARCRFVFLSIVQLNGLASGVVGSWQPEEIQAGEKIVDCRRCRRTLLL
jgi:hypothetical protein